MRISGPLAFVLLVTIPSASVAQKPSPLPQGVVYSVTEDQTTGVLTINGTNLVLAGVQPVVTLGTIDLPLITATPSEIAAQLPAGVDAATYFLTVLRGTKDIDVTYFAAVIGEVGPKGETGDMGPQGLTGSQGPKGDTGAKGETGDPGSPGPQGLTGSQGPQGDTGANGLPGPQGPSGTNGVSGWQRVSVDWSMPAVGASIGAFAQCPAGKKALGGGWFGPSSHEVTFARDEPSDTAYNVIVRNVSSPLPNYIRITVICATVQ